MLEPWFKPEPPAPAAVLLAPCCPASGAVNVAYALVCRPTSLRLREKVGWLVKFAPCIIENEPACWMQMPRGEEFWVSRNLSLCPFQHMLKSTFNPRKKNGVSSKEFPAFHSNRLVPKTFFYRNSRAPSVWFITVSKVTDGLIALKINIWWIFETQNLAISSCTLD